MNCYKHSMLEEDGGSVASVHFSEGISSTTTHIRYHTGLSACHKRSTLEKWLMVTTCIMFLLLIVALVTYPGEKKLLQKEEYCLTETCIHTSANIISAMNEKANPCDNFYEFSCGRWIQSNPVPNGKPMWNTFSKIEYKNEVVLKKILENMNITSAPERKAKDYYISCVDKNETVQKLGSKPLLNLIHDVGGWKAIDDNFSIADWNFHDAFHKIRKRYNFGGLFSWYVGEDDKNSSVYVIQIDQGGLILPARDMYLNKTANSKILSSYLDYMTAIAVHLGGNESSARQQMQDVIDFETALANITVPDDQRRTEESMYRKMTLKELTETAPFLNWTSFMRDLFSNVNYTITDENEVVIYTLKYLKDLSDFLLKYHLGENVSERNKTTLHNYVMWHSVRSFVPYLSENFVSILKNFEKILYGSENSDEAWRVCVSSTANFFGYVLGRLYVKEVFNRNSKPLAEEMIRNVKNAFKDNFKTRDWMDEETIKLAEDKAEAVSGMIGFPRFAMNITRLGIYYENVTISPDKYFENIVRLNRNSFVQVLAKLGKATQKETGIYPSTVNAYYSAAKNRMVFPAGILQPPFFNQDQLMALNYGAMGVIMGHELTHGFDDVGRRYDKYGNMHQWWHNKTIEAFQERTQCFIKQYDNFESNGNHVNGLSTLGENIADNGGLKAAYRAYAKWEQEKGPERRLPGLDFTNDQLFFISFAQVWCAYKTGEAAALIIEKDSHAPNMFRVLGPLSNMKEFSDAFHCPKDSKMNPSKKCELW